MEDKQHILRYIKQHPSPQDTVEQALAKLPKHESDRIARQRQEFESDLRNISPASFQVVALRTSLCQG
jgi:hypothetical protein